MDIAINHGNFGNLNRLPLELWHKILLLLPLKALATLCVVNKSFKSLIRDPEFAPFHLQHNYKPQLLNVNCFVQADGCCFYGVPEIGVFTGVLYTDETMYWYIAGSINGLILLVSNHHNHEMRVVLWNPSIRKYRKLPLPANFLRTFALGYDRVRNDHKIVATSEQEAWVYSVRTGSWTEATWVVESGFRPYTFGMFSFYYEDSLSFKDGAVWTQSDYTKLDLFELVLFDFEAEMFHYAEKMNFKKSHRGLVMLDGGCTVGFWAVEGEHQMTTSIWELQKDSMTWRKRYQILREIVPWTEGFETVSFEESDDKLVWKFRMPGGTSLEVSRYTLGSNSLWCDQENTLLFDGGFLSSYVESLFMLS